MLRTKQYIRGGAVCSVSNSRNRGGNNEIRLHDVCTLRNDSNGNYCSRIVCLQRNTLVGIAETTCGRRLFQKRQEDQRHIGQDFRNLLATCTCNISWLQFHFQQLGKKLDCVACSCGTVCRGVSHCRSDCRKIRQRQQRVKHQTLNVTILNYIVM